MHYDAAHFASARRHPCARSHGKPREYHDQEYPLPGVDHRRMFRLSAACNLEASSSSVAANDEVSHSGQLAFDSSIQDGIDRVDA